MKLAMIGTGYVGLVTGACFADLGNNVICVDINDKKLEILKKGNVPFYEPGLGEILQRNIREGRLNFTSDIKEAIKNSEIIFICVGTPEGNDGHADLKYVMQAAEDIAKNMEDYKIIVMKSTVPVGTNEKISRLIKQNTKVSFDVVSNPEFLREGAAVKDFQNPDRVVVGTKSEKAKKIMGKLYKTVARATRPLIFTDPKNAELIKYASNAMLAARISFVNELSHLCEAVGANIKEVAKGMGLDDRIGSRFLNAGAGYGGSCFPKDVRALAQTMEQYGSTSNFLRAIDYINDRQKKSLVPKLKKFLPSLENKKIAIWGLSFKPRTSDIRNATSLTVISQLLDDYAEVIAFDPEATEEAKEVLKTGVAFAKNPYEALEGVSALIVCTEWDEFRVPDFDKMKKAMKELIIIDGRNIFDPEEMKEHGFKYQGVGR